MKKVAFIVSLMFVALTMTAAPNITSKSRIYLATAGQDPTALNFLMGDPGNGKTWSDAMDQGWDSEDVNDAIYILSGGKRYMRWVSNKYSKNLILGIKANGINTSYTFTFDNDYFSGDTYEIYDRVADQTIVVNGSTAEYQFTVEDNDAVPYYINDRFVINKYFEPDDPPLEICFNEDNDNNLVIKNNPYAFPIVIKNAADEEVLSVDPQPTKISGGHRIDLSSLEAGKYTVLLDEGRRKFVIVKK